MRKPHGWILPAVFAVTVAGATASRATAVPFNDLATFLAAAGPTTLIDFEHDGTGATPVDGAQIGDTFAALGISFPAGNTFTSTFAGPVSGDWGWLNDTIVGSDRRFDAVFLGPGIRAVGVHNVFNGGVPAGSLLRAFDASDNLIESVLSDSVGTTPDFFGLVTDVDIARFEVLVLNPQGWGLDDLHFGEAAAPVPEPNPQLLTGAALLGLCALARRKA
jgi:hypothetical protein